MVLSYRSTVLRRVDPARIGPEICEHLGQLADRIVALAERRPQLARADIAYDELVADPAAAIERAYSRLGLDVGPEMRRRLHAEAARSRRHRPFRGALGLRELGVRPEQVRDRFAAYLSRRAEPVAPWHAARPALGVAL
jgi:hypothetical protein